MESREKFHLQRFSPKDFFEKSSENGKYIKFTENAERLAAQYYNEKYQANICIPEESDIFKFAENVQDYIASARKSTKDIRVAFLVTNKTSSIISNHVTPIIYIKENNEEGILYPDSLGSRFPIKSHLVKILQEKTGISIYLVEDRRQEDAFSCVVDALIVVKDATRLDPLNKQFYIPQLLSKLKTNPKLENGINVVLLPNKLLKTSQLSFFTQKHAVDSDEDIHKKQSLKEFLNKHPNYVKEKGLKLKDIVEIQFYLNQLRNLSNSKWNKELENAYINQAKLKVKTKTQKTNRLYEFTKEFIAQIEKIEISNTSVHSKSMS